MTAVANTLAQSIPMMATSTSLSTTCTVGGRGSPLTAHKLSIRYVDLASWALPQDTVTVLVP